MTENDQSIQRELGQRGIDQLLKRLVPVLEATYDHDPIATEAVGYCLGVLTGVLTQSKKLGLQFLSADVTEALCSLVGAVEDDIKNLKNAPKDPTVFPTEAGAFTAAGKEIHEKKTDATFRLIKRTNGYEVIVVPRGRDLPYYL